MPLPAICLIAYTQRICPAMEPIILPIFCQALFHSPCPTPKCNNWFCKVSRVSKVPLLQTQFAWENPTHYTTLLLGGGYMPKLCLRRKPFVFVAKLSIVVVFSPVKFIAHDQLIHAFQCTPNLLFNISSPAQIFAFPKLLVPIYTSLYTNFHRDFP